MHIKMLALIALLLTYATSAYAWKQDRFIITFWCPPPATDEAFSAVKGEGYNLIPAPVEGLDVALKHHLRVLVQDSLLVPTTLDDAAQRTKLDALIETVRKHPAAEGYFITDEPGAGAFPELGRLVSYLHERDPGHFAYINLLPCYASREQLGVSADAVERAKVGMPLNYAGVGASQNTIAAYAEHLRDYVHTVRPELISYDHYHFLKTGDGAQYFLNLELIRQAALKADLPFLNIIQSWAIDPPWRLTNKSELRFLVYTTMAYGGRGISYFLYWGTKSYLGLYQDGVRSPLALDVADLNKEINALSPVLMNLTSVGVYHTEPLPFGAQAIPYDSLVEVEGKANCVIGLFSEKGRTTDTFMVVNRDYRRKQAVRLKLAKKCGLKELDPLTGKWKSYCDARSNSVVTVELLPGGGRLFRMTSLGS